MNPITAFFEWLAGLLKAIFGGKSVAPKPEKSADEPVSGEPKWLKIARGELGVKEAPGAANNPRVLKYYADAGHPEVDADSVAWCAAFTGACLERSGYASSKSLLARSYLTWGKEVKKPVPGCIAVFSRGDVRGWQGHVGFYIDEDAKGIRILAGNQGGDQVCIERQDRERLLGYRVPVTPMNSRTMKASTAQMGLLGLDGVAILESQGQINVIGDLIGQIGLTIPAFLVASILLKIALQCVIIYARQDDAATKGR
jgi:uncharacterized protein (TIGR02594 family)